MMNPEAFDDYQDFLDFHVGRVLLRARKKKGMSQVELADTVGINDGTLRRIEAGKGSMRSKHIKAICAALDLRLDDVVYEALYSFWTDFQKRAVEGGEADSENPWGPYRRLQETILDKFDANAKAQRELLEAQLDMEAFIHFKRRLEDLKH